MRALYRRNFIKKSAILVITAVSICLLDGCLGQSSDILASEQNTHTLRKGPYLIYEGKNTEMKVLWQLYGKSECQIKWGVDTSYSLGSKETVEYGNDHQHSYTLRNLKPGNKYYYQVMANGKRYPGSFHAAPASGATKLKFFVYGDTRSRPKTHDTVAQGIISTYTADRDIQTLIISVGDLVKFGAEESEWDEQFFDPAQKKIQEMLANLPYQACIGNHELFFKDYRDTDYSLRLFKKYFPYPFVEHAYWSFDYGPVHFVMVDQYYYDGFLKKLKDAKSRLNELEGSARSLEKQVKKYRKRDEGKAAEYSKKAQKAAAKAEKARENVAILEKQAEEAQDDQLSWIKTDLASTKKSWIFLVYHEPGWSAHGLFAHSNNVEVQEYLQPLMEKYNVSIAFAGHNHYYARALVNGVHHITTGGGGAPLHHNPDADSPRVITFMRANHFCKVVIDGNLMKYTAVKPDGMVIDRFTVTRVETVSRPGGIHGSRLITPKQRLPKGSGHP
jgi:hypothetical protein